MSETKLPKEARSPFNPGPFHKEPWLNPIPGVPTHNLDGPSRPDVGSQGKPTPEVTRVTGTVVSYQLEFHDSGQTMLPFFRAWIRPDDPKVDSDLVEVTLLRYRPGTDGEFTPSRVGYANMCQAVIATFKEALGSGMKVTVTWRSSAEMLMGPGWHMEGNPFNTNAIESVAIVGTV